MLVLVTFPLASAAPLHADPAKDEDKDTSSKAQAAEPSHAHGDAPRGQEKQKEKDKEKEKATGNEGQDGPDTPGPRWARSPSGYQSAGPDDDPDPAPPRGREGAPGQVNDKPQGGGHPDDGAPGAPGGGQGDGAPATTPPATTPPATTPPATTPPATTPPATTPPAAAPSDGVALPAPGATSTVQLDRGLDRRVVPASTPVRSVDLIRLISTVPAPTGPDVPPAGAPPATPAVTPPALQAPFGPPLSRGEVAEVVTVTFPLTLAAVVLAFLLLHGRGDRSDPKLVESPLDGEADRVDFS